MSEEAPASDGGSITYLTPVRPSAFPSEWYEISSVDHFWFEWRLRAALRLVKRCNRAPDAALRALDIGGGSGLLREQVESHTRWTVDLTDLNLTALRSARSGRGRTLYYDVLQCEPSLREAYDAAFLFDVIEHVDQPRPLLAAVAAHLRPDGVLFVNVPALPSLMSAYDRAAGHVRRYNRGSLRAELSGLGYAILDARYWGLSLLPLLVVRKLLLGRTPTATTIRRGFAPPSRIVHAALRALMTVETSLLALPPVGTSLLLAARRT